MSARWSGKTFDEIRLLAETPPPNGRADLFSLKVFATHPALVAGFEIIQPQGGLAERPFVAGAVTVLSDNAQDSPSGSGAASIRIFALDGNLENPDKTKPYEPYAILESPLDGVNAVNVDPGTDYMRINDAVITSRGSGATSTPSTNLGTVTVSIAGVPTFLIMPGVGRGQSVEFTIPGEWEGTTDRFEVSWTGNREAELNCIFDKDGLRTLALESTFSGTSTIDPTVFHIPESTDVSCRAKLLAGSTAPMTFFTQIVLSRL